MAFIAVGDKKVADTTPDLTPYALAQDVEEAFENVVSVEDIAKEITSESTDDEVASAKAVFDELADKADKNYGAENKGKMLVVGEDGEITPDEPTLSTVAMTKNAWQIYDKSKLKDGQEVIITDDDSAEGVIDDSAPRGDATYSSQKIEDFTKNKDLSSNVVLSSKLTPEKHRVTRSGNVVMVNGRINVNTALAKDDIIFSGLPKLQETFMYFDVALFDHTPDVASGYVRLNSDGTIAADNAIQPGLYRFSICYITSDI